MFVSNAGLRPKDDGTISTHSSTPWMWPIAYQVNIIHLKYFPKSNDFSFQMQLLGHLDDLEAPKNDEDQSIFSVFCFNPWLCYVNLASIGIFAALGLLHCYKIIRNVDEKQSDRGIVLFIKVSLLTVFVLDLTFFRSTLLILDREFSIWFNSTFRS